MSGPLLHVLTGCTAVGKTEWALRWAEKSGAEILSCDSLLFYRGMDIGTAKPTPAERARVPHHLIDVLDVTEPMNVAAYVLLAKAAAESIRARNRPILVVGGSGFYLKSFFSAVADSIEVPAALRRSIEDRLQAEGLEPLLADLRRLNPGGLGPLDTGNPRRVARALERCVASGRTLGELADAFAVQPAPFAGWKVVLARIDRDPEDLGRRIEARVDAMLQQGLVEEVRSLAASGLGRNPSASAAIGYRETLAMLEGRMAAADLRSAIVRSTRSLVKKQRTWFRTQLPPHRVLAAGSLQRESELFAVS